MLNKKFITTALVPEELRVPLTEVPAHKPSIFRIFGIGWSIFLLIHFALRARIRRRSNPREMAIRIRKLFEDLGGMWIKLGQVLSMRNDLFSPESRCLGYRKVNRVTRPDSSFRSIRYLALQV